MSSSRSLLIEERVVCAQPSVVGRLGLAPAVVLQQLHWHLGNGDTLTHGDEDWTPVTYADLSREIGISGEQVRRAIEALERAGVVLSCQPEGRTTRRKSYRIDHDHPLLRAGGSASRSGETAASGSGETAASSSLLEEQDSSPSGETRDQEQSKPRRERPRNLIFDALAEVFPPSTKSEQSLVGAVAAELRPMNPPPDLVREVARLVQHEWPTASVRAVTTHWTQFARRARQQAQPGGGAGPPVAERCSRCGELTIDCLCPREAGP